MTEDSHAPLRRPAFDFEHLRAFEFLEPRVREVEGDRDARHAVRGEPFVGEPEVGTEAGQSAILQFGPELGDSWVELTAFDRHAKLPHAEIEQPLVGPCGPLFDRDDSVLAHRDVQSMRFPTAPLV
jgi:hypothetical protein